MATSGSQLIDGGNRVAAVDLSAAQYLAVKQTTTPRQVNLASTGGEAIAGILQNTPGANQAASIVQRGIARAVIGAGGVTAGDQLQTEATTGKLITKVSTNVVVGVAIETVAAGGVATVDIGATG